MLLIASTRSRGFLGANFLAAAVKFRKELMHLKSSHESASEGKTVNKGELKGLHTPRGADFRAELRWRAAAHEFSSGCFFRNSISGAPAPNHHVFYCGKSSLAMGRWFLASRLGLGACRRDA